MPETVQPLPSLSLAECLRQAAPRDLVLTASNRLARELKNRFTAAGHRLLPVIRPYASWLGDSWQRLQWEAALRGGDGSSAVLLNDAQEELLWERCLREAGAADRLMFLGDTVRACMRAYRNMQEYRIPRPHPAFDRSIECRLFLDWAGAVEAACARQGWLSPANLAAWLSTRLGALPGLPRQQVYLAGFEEITPAQQDLFRQLQATAAGCWLLEESPTAAAAQVWVHAAPDPHSEWRHAAEWARQRVRDYPSGRFAVVVPELAANHAQVVRVFEQVFHPEREAEAAPSRGSSVHLSFAPPLTGSILVQTALCLLRMIPGAASLNDIRLLLRSPYGIGGIDEADHRALLEVRLLDERQERIPFDRLLRVAAKTGRSLAALQLPQWQSLVSRLQEAAASIAGNPERAPSSWAALVRALWTSTLGLDVSYTSEEFQMRHRLLEELGAMAFLDVVQPSCTWGEFRQWLRARLEQTGFQPDRPGGQVLVAGMYEVSGLRFDAVWISGLTHKVLPRPVSPDPFLPLELQREAGLPRADVDQELRFAGRLFARLCRLAPELVLSYPRREGEEVQQATPLLRGMGELPSYVPLDIAGEDQPPAPLAEDYLADWNGGPLQPAGPVIPGGTALLKNQSDCPFRAFVTARLGSESPEWQAPLMDRLDQGTMVHAALEKFWQRTRSRQALVALDDEQLSLRISQCVDEALELFLAGPEDQLALAQKDAERSRLQLLLANWLAEEQAREPFTVLETEARRSLPLAGASLRMRADRIDQLADGSLALIDYKTGETNAKKWLGPRPEEPQLLAYLAAEDRPVGALAFASLKAGETGWKFYGRNGGAAFFPGAGSKTKDAPQGWDGFLQEGRQAVAGLLEQMARGEAAVDPRNPSATCTHCSQKPLCRFAEWRTTSAEEDDAEGGEQP